MEKKKTYTDMIHLGKLIRKYDKSILKLLLVRSVVNSIGVYFSSVSLGLVIDCLTRQSGPDVMYVVLAIGCGSGGIALLRLLLSKVIDRKNFFMEQQYRKSKTAACFAVNYEKVESAEFQDLRQNIRHSDDNMGTFSGILGLFERFYETVATLLFGIGILFTMVVSARLDSPGEMVLVAVAAVLIIGCAAGSTRLVRRLQESSTQKVPGLFHELSQGNRLGMYLLEHNVHNYNMGKDIRIYRTENLINRELKKMTDSMGACYKKICVHSSMPTTVSDISSGILGGVIYVFTAVAAVLGYISIGSVVICADSIRNVLGNWSDYFICLGEFSVLRSRLGYTEELFSMAEEETGEPVQGSTELCKLHNPERISFEHVYFRYPNSEEWVLRDVSFEIRKGERLSIVGKNGAGKTTAIKLLCGLYQPQEGCIRVDGVDIREIPGEIYREMLATVFQDFKLFSFSVADNLAMGEKFDEEAAKEIFREVGLEQRMESLSDGVHTVLYHDYEDGVEVSGGEAQKLALARCRYKNAPVMILDEPTSALDAKTEMEIFSDMERISAGKTVVYVSHRLSACRLSDRILVFDKGRVVQSGSHGELVKADGSVYQELWNAQAQYYV